MDANTQHTCTHAHTLMHTHTRTHARFPGHRTYMAYMYMEYTYNNLIVRLFVHRLLESLHKRRQYRQRATQRPLSSAVFDWRNGSRERG